MAFTEDATKPYEGQKPGTSGLRKKVKVFQQPNYLANFIQSIFDSLDQSIVTGGTLVVGGDGRYWNKDAVQIVADIAAANGVARLWIGQNGLLSTPAVSAIIRQREGGVAFGGILLTASHNPGGPEDDFGVKYNGENGGPVVESVTDKIYENTRTIKRVKRSNIPTIDLSTIKGAVEIIPGKFKVEVIDPVVDWMNVMKTVFDFEMIRGLMRRKDFTMVYDGMHGVAGPYAKSTLVNELGADTTALLNCEPKEDFGKGHPDPNLKYAAELVSRLSALDETKVTADTPIFGAAGDGDCDRNMILGAGFFVTPSDSVAIIAAHAKDCIPYFAKSGIKGLSRSMPTSAALDAVAKKLKVQLYEVPTGWKFFGNLMDDGRLSICGEESFGTGSDHVREKDGIWAVLAWLSILAHLNKSTPEGKLIGVKQIVQDFWKEFGRNYYCRYDYENVETEAADKLMAHLRSAIGGDVKTISTDKVTIKTADDFTYHDPVDKSVSANQGVRYVCPDGSRVVWRLSGTGSSGATIRIYFEKFSQTDLGMKTADALKDMIEFGLKICKVEEFTGRKEPTVIT